MLGTEVCLVSATDQFVACLQLAARAMVAGESQMSEAAAAEEAPAGNADSSPMLDNSHTEAPQAAAAKAVTSAAIAAELHTLSDKPQRSLLLRRSASLPSNLSSLAQTTFIPLPQQGMPINPSHQERSLTYSTNLGTAPQQGPWHFGVPSVVKGNSHASGVQPVYVQPDPSSGFLMAFVPAASVSAAAHMSVLSGAAAAAASAAPQAAVAPGSLAAACLPRASAPIASGRPGVTALPKPFGMHNAGSSLSKTVQSTNADMVLPKPFQPNFNACKEVQNLARPEHPSTAKLPGAGEYRPGIALKRPSAGIVEDKENYFPDARQVTRNVGPQQGVVISANPGVDQLQSNGPRGKVDSKSPESSNPKITDAKMHFNATCTTATSADASTEDREAGRKRVKLGSE